MTAVLTTGVALFIVSSLIFYFWGQQKELQFNKPVLVSLVTLASYLVMLEGSFASFELGAADTYWTRWVFYAFSCGLLMHTISKKLNFSPAKRADQLYLTAFVMLTGALAAIYTGLAMWLFFGVSTFAFIILVLPIFFSSEKVKSKILPFVIFGWSVFPIVFLLEPAGLDLITSSAAAWVYLALDFFTKILFYFFVSAENSDQD